MDIGVYGARAIPSTYSGYETFLTTLLPALAARDHRVTMYCRRGEAVGTGDYEGVQRVFLPAIKGKVFETLSHGAVSAIRARRAAHDVVLVVNVANAAFCALSRYTGQPVILNTDGQEWLRGKWGWAGRKVFYGSARLAKRCATGLVSDCVAMADVYQAEFGAASTVIPYCFPPLPPHRAEAVAAYGVEPDGYFMVGGRLNPENNIDRIAELYSRSSLPYPLLVLGTANYDSPVQRRLRDLSEDPRIRMLGHVDDRGVFLGLLAGARGYLHGHSVGGINPSLVEAMRAGAFVVALDTPFNHEALGEAGSYFSLDDDVRFLDILAAAAVLPDAERAEARSRARTRAETTFSIEAVVGAYEEILVAAAGRGQPAPLRIRTLWSGEDPLSCDEWGV